ncbi:acyltransferase, partial [Nostoc sp. 3335mG]
MSTTAPTNNHYPALDGLRGIAALLVVAFHLFEAHARGDMQRQIVNHGYLAVDFFFLLSGFVIAHAYDDRWPHMSIGDFVRRRLIRLQPMVVLGSMVGMIVFALAMPMTGDAVSTPRLLAIMLLGAAMIPLAPHTGIRSGEAMYPLNGAAWSLFYEYLANAFYAAGIRDFSNRTIGLIVALSALAVIHLAVFGPRGDLVGGWAFDGWGIHIGLTRVMFPFVAGILLRRMRHCVAIPGGFPVSAALLIAALAMPRIGGTDRLWLNGLYEAGCVLLLFPLIVVIGAGGVTDDRTEALSQTLGDLSYPLYVTHYPVACLYAAWVELYRPSFEARLLVGLATFAAMIALAYASLTLWDAPVRRWLSRRQA